MSSSRFPAKCEAGVGVNGGLDELRRGLNAGELNGL